MSPHETLCLESTQNVDISLVANNNFIRFQTWDFGGDLSLNNDVVYLGKKISIENVFKNCSTLIYVVDAQDDDFEDALPLARHEAAIYQVNVCLCLPCMTEEGGKCVRVTRGTQPSHPSSMYRCCEVCKEL